MIAAAVKRGGLQPVPAKLVLGPIRRATLPIFVGDMKECPAEHDLGHFKAASGYFDPLLSRFEMGGVEKQFGGVFRQFQAVGVFRDAD